MASYCDFVMLKVNDNGKDELDDKEEEQEAEEEEEEEEQEEPTVEEILSAAVGKVPDVTEILSNSTPSAASQPLLLHLDPISAAPTTPQPQISDPVSQGPSMGLPPFGMPSFPGGGGMYNPYMMPPMHGQPQQQYQQEAAPDLQRQNLMIWRNMMAARQQVPLPGMMPGMQPQGLPGGGVARPGEGQTPDSSREY
ncbi:uncharacterized protein PAC_19782 [Phialocephala subalpina]|uniref:Uncharacterized protein n=1 Tax=Phialocephala subalpina TaxID=576137 RepID=A0A1L7XXS7_9HELO|nr:uncharacterized protein PAC_19782 [Phialocephala subalpina]